MFRSVPRVVLPGRPRPSDAVVAAPMAAVDGVAGDVSGGGGMRRTGVRVELQVDDVPGVDAETGLFAYRIVQEALTNCLKHAGGAPVSVHLRVDGADLMARARRAAPEQLPRGLPSVELRHADVRRRAEGGPARVGTFCRGCRLNEVDGLSYAWWRPPALRVAG